MFCLLFLFPVLLSGQSEKAVLKLVTDSPHQWIVAFYDQFDQGGNTSVAHDMENSYKWSGFSPYLSGGWGYFNAENIEIPYIKRDRDLGQTFYVESDAKVRLKSITVKLGFGDNVVRTNTYGTNLSLQIFAVTGIPVINENGSVKGISAFHGFPHDRLGKNIQHDRDDYYEGEIFTTLAVIRGYTFPSKTDFGFCHDSIVISPDHPGLKGRLLQFVVPGDICIVLEPETTYAFLIMIDKPGENTGFTLANSYYGNYPSGHAIRRDGNGTFPPASANPLKDFNDPENSKAFESAHFPQDFDTRIAVSPGTNGYPDVDTWRDLFFFVQAEPVVDYCPELKEMIE